MVKLFTIVLCYLLIAALFFIVNFFRLKKCILYQSLYNDNFKNNTPNNNYTIKHTIISLLNKAHISLKCNVVSLVADRAFTKEFNNAFENAKGYFIHRMLHSPMWIALVAEGLTLFIPAFKIKHKIFACIFALIEAFVVYLFGLFLDTTGIGDKILVHLLDIATALFERLSVFFP